MPSRGQPRARVKPDCLPRIGHAPLDRRCGAPVRERTHSLGKTAHRVRHAVCFLPHFSLCAKRCLVTRLPCYSPYRRGPAVLQFRQHNRLRYCCVQSRNREKRTGVRGGRGSRETAYEKEVQRCTTPPREAGEGEGGPVPHEAAGPLHCNAPSPYAKSTESRVSAGRLSFLSGASSAALAAAPEEPPAAASHRPCHCAGGEKQITQFVLSR